MSIMAVMAVSFMDRVSSLTRLTGINRWPTSRPSKRLAVAVALVGKEAHPTAAGAAVTGDQRVGRTAGLRAQPLLPQLLDAGADDREIVGGSRLTISRDRKSTCLNSR